MDCEKLKKEYPKVNFEPCCESCHEEDEMGFGGDLWFKIDGKDWHICCAASRSLDKRKHEEI